MSPRHRRGGDRLLRRAGGSADGRREAGCRAERGARRTGRGSGAERHRPVRDDAACRSQRRPARDGRGAGRAACSSKSVCVRRRAAPARSLRAAAGSLVNDVTQAVAEATRRFAATADELRRAAQEMQRELSQTRDELQKGVLEMPAEARRGEHRHAPRHLRADRGDQRVVEDRGAERRRDRAPPPPRGAPPNAAGDHSECAACAAAGARRKPQMPAAGATRVAPEPFGKPGSAAHPRVARRRARVPAPTPRPGETARQERRGARLGRRPPAPRFLERDCGRSPSPTQPSRTPPESVRRRRWWNC